MVFSSMPIEAHIVYGLVFEANRGTYCVWFSFRSQYRLKLCMFLIKMHLEYIIEYVDDEE